jgi:long-chain acyl-CoA synthetase
VAAKCKGVVECACLGIPDEKTGEAVKLFVVKAADSTISAEDIIAHCREHLTSYKVPKAITFIDELPKSAVGKMLRRVLREL